MDICVQRVDEEAVDQLAQSGVVTGVKVEVDHGVGGYLWTRTPTHLTRTGKVGRIEDVLRKFLPNIPRSLGYAREALERFPEYAGAREILGKYLPEHF